MHGDVVRKVNHPKRIVPLTANEFTRNRLQGVFLRSLDGQQEIGVVPRKTDVQLDAAEVLRHPEASSLVAMRSSSQVGAWVKPVAAEPMIIGVPEFEKELAAIRQSWRGAFRYDEELVMISVAYLFKGG